MPNPHNQFLKLTPMREGGDPGKGLLHISQNFEKTRLWETTGFIFCVLDEWDYLYRGYK